MPFVLFVAKNDLFPDWFCHIIHEKDRLQNSFPPQWANFVPFVVMPWGTSKSFLPQKAQRAQKNIRINHQKRPVRTPGLQPLMPGEDTGPTIVNHPFQVFGVGAGAGVGVTVLDFRAKRAARPSKFVSNAILFPANFACWYTISAAV